MPSFGTKINCPPVPVVDLKTFSSVIGQEHIVTTLINQVATGKVAHAYLFSGPRGVGKTTLARILAKAVIADARATPAPRP